MGKIRSTYLVKRTMPIPSMTQEVWLLHHLSKASRADCGKRRTCFLLVLLPRDRTDPLADGVHSTTFQSDVPNAATILGSLNSSCKLVTIRFSTCSPRVGVRTICFRLCWINKSQTLAYSSLRGVLHHSPDVLF